MSVCLVCQFFVSAWSNTLVLSHQQLSPATLSDFSRSWQRLQRGSVSLLPSIRPALVETVGERLNQRREVGRFLPEKIRPQALSMSAFAAVPLPQEQLERCLAASLPQIKIVVPITPSSYILLSNGNVPTNRPFVREGANSSPLSLIEANKTSNRVPQTEA